jgi:hypothetical protein
MGEDRRDLRLHGLLKARDNQRPIYAMRKQGAEGAIGQRQTDLETNSIRDDALFTQRPKYKIGIDRIAGITESPARIAEPDG